MSVGRKRGVFENVLAEVAGRGRKMAEGGRPQKKRFYTKY
jgi:hypothetical protein